MSVVAIVPFKGLDRGKQRLAACLSPSQRSLLNQRMLEDVLRCARAACVFDDICVLSVELPAVSGDCRWLQDLGHDLNSSLSSAAARAARFADSVVVLPADLPSVSAADLRTVVAAARVHAVVVIPDARGSGTNALGLSPPTAIVPRFGTNSRYCHEAAARERGLTTTTLLLSSLASDVDEPADLERLVAKQPDRYGFLRDLQRTA